MKTIVRIHHRQPQENRHAYRVISFSQERDDGVPLGNRLDILAVDNVGTALAIMGCLEINAARALIEKALLKPGDHVLDISDGCLSAEALQPSAPEEESAMEASPTAKSASGLRRNLLPEGLIRLSKNALSLLRQRPNDIPPAASLRSAPCR